MNHRNIQEMKKFIYQIVEKELQEKQTRLSYLSYYYNRILSKIVIL